MKEKWKNNGFSLTEILIAVGILSVGLLFLASTFSAGIRFTTIAYERTIASIAAEEAFAKIRLFGPDSGLTENRQTPLFDPNIIDPNEFAYPSTGADITQKRYFWSALGRWVDNSSVQVTVFASRKTGPHLTYYVPGPGGTVSWPIIDNGFWPVPVKVDVLPFSINELEISTEEKTFINDGYTIVDDETGKIYRVLERYASPDDNVILLDRNWEAGVLFLANGGGSVWVVPPPINAGRYPCIAVYQKVIKF
jgi:prepilin-type N-terminal cleavage/methylation domain-containing protein